MSKRDIAGFIQDRISTWQQRAADGIDWSPAPILAMYALRDIVNECADQYYMDSPAATDGLNLRVLERIARIWGRDPDFDPAWRGEGEAEPATGDITTHRDRLTAEVLTLQSRLQEAEVRANRAERAVEECRRALHAFDHPEEDYEIVD